jgi:hypothetical protein
MEELRPVNGFRHTKNDRKKKKWQDFEVKRLLKNRLFQRLVENVQMQVELCEIPLCRRSRSRDGSARNRGPARRVGSPSEARTNPEK